MPSRSACRPMTADGRDEPENDARQRRHDGDRQQRRRRPVQAEQEPHGERGQHNGDEQATTGERPVPAATTLVLGHSALSTVLMRWRTARCPG